MKPERYSNTLYLNGMELKVNLSIRFCLIQLKKVYYVHSTTPIDSLTPISPVEGLLEL